MKYIVILTGGIGSGKTTTSKLFSHLGVDVIDADIISRNILNEDNQILQKIFNKFGKEIVIKDNILNRIKLRRIIFNSPDLKKWLEDLMHPIIYNKIFQQIEKSKSLWCLIVLPIVIENYLKLIADRILVIDIHLKIQLKRTIIRDNENIKNIKNIITLQTKKQDRLDIANDIIDNSGSYEDLLSKIIFFNRFYCFLAKKKLDSHTN